jgi:hypothetical protein
MTVADPVHRETLNGSGSFEVGLSMYGLYMDAESIVNCRMEDMRTHR